MVWEQIVSDLFCCDEIEPWDEGLAMRTYTADFETTTLIDDCRVWAYALCDCDDIEHVEYGTSIGDFIKNLEAIANCKVYFHNLAFDGAFIIDYLEKNGWAWVPDKSERSENTYTTLISDMNQVYNICLYFTPYFKVDIYDSLKIIPLSIKQMARAYGMDEGKGDLDYTSFREVGHVLTDEEKDYIRRDVQIAAKAVSRHIEEGLVKMTAGSNALYDYKRMLGGAKGFRKMFPALSHQQDDFIRKAYRGGFTYCNPKYKGRLLGNGIVFDVNSLYPSVMAATDGQVLPYGEPKWFDGEPGFDEKYPLWVALVTCSFKVREDHIPCMQLKGNFRFGQTEYLSDSRGEVTFCVTSVDWALINAQYSVSFVSWHGGYRFKACDYQFKKYVDKWTEVKVEAARQGNGGLRTIAKLMLNSLYGKFATRTTVHSRRPVLDSDGVVRYRDLEPEEREGVYLPVGVFITAYARYKTVAAAQSVFDRFVYADTDSIHLVGTEVPENLDVDPYRLGAWKHESTFSSAKFLGAKCYCEQIDGEDGLTVHVAGMPSVCHKSVTLDNFDTGAAYPGKLYQHRVPGGIVLVEGDIVIRERV